MKKEKIESDDPKIEQISKIEKNIRTEPEKEQNVEKLENKRKEPEKEQNDVKKEKKKRPESKMVKWQCLNCSAKFQTKKMLQIHLVLV